MRVYGKALPEIFQNMPLSYKIIVLAGLLWIPFTVIHATSVYISLGKNFSKAGLTRFTMMPANTGLMDPSVVDGGKKEVYMTFSIISSISGGVKVAPHVILATTIQPCKSWIYRGEVFSASSDELIGPDFQTPISTVSWWTETPTIVYDPDDPGKEFKVFAYKYPWSGYQNFKDPEGLAQLYGTINYRYSSEPEMGKWSDEEGLFSAKTGVPPPPYDGHIQFHLNDFDPSLQDVKYYARPSAVYMNGVIYMTLSAFVEGKHAYIDKKTTAKIQTPDRVIMIASQNHGLLWHYVGTLLRHDDVAKLGPYTTLGGASIIMKKGKLYLAAVLGDKDTTGVGTFIMPFTNPAKGELQQDPKTGLPLIANFLPHSAAAPSHSGGGYAGFTDKCDGLFVSEFSAVRKSFQIFTTLKDPLEPGH